MPAESDDATFPARRDAFARVRTFLEEACARAEVPRGDTLRLVLVIEELFTNTVVHGFGEDTDAPVRLALTVTDRAIAVEYEDSARPYDPFARPRASHGDDLDARPVGGLGVHLVTTMAEEVAYVRREGWNSITFRLSRSR